MKIFRLPLFKNLIQIIFIILIVKLFAFYKDMKIGTEFGINQFTDNFFIAILIPSYIYNVIIGSMKSIFIPNYIYEMKTNEKIHHFQNGLFIYFLGIAFLCIGLSYLLSYFYLNTTPTIAHSQWIENIKFQNKLGIICILFWFISNFYCGILEIHKKFIYSNLTPIFTSIIYIFNIYNFKTEFGVNILSISLLMGSIVECIFVVMICLYYKYIRLHIPTFKNQNIFIIFKQFPPKILSGLLSGGKEFFNQYFASFLIIGSVTSLNYAIKIPGFINSIISLGFSSLLIPYFSNLIHENKQESSKKLFKIVHLTFLGTFFVVGILELTSTYLIQFLFERGQFTSQNTIIISDLQKLYLLTLPFGCCSIIFIRYLGCLNRNWKMVQLSLISLLLNIILNYFLSKYFGIQGIAITHIIVDIMYFILLYYYLKKYNI